MKRMGFLAAQSVDLIHVAAFLGHMGFATCHVDRSLRACNARHLGEIGKDDKKFPLPNKNDEKVSPVKTLDEPKFKQALSNQLVGEDMVKQSRVGKDDQPKPISSMAKELEGQTGESHVYVSWHLPHKKQGEPQPGFNLDYEPPKTHPPVHN
ncbi:hypothetical protein TEA_024045 [Camellia sinensis var. sinensis]|uniref:Uncharacterized protein n=1 Tax=Camellia sinensis var. sinensis TaxID=542762 RepID=A0A4S4E0G4_CAMSN|nr:hypothetical protein TEA_024045 [Camellia sinensis var. sinensis]